MTHSQIAFRGAFVATAGFLVALPVLLLLLLMGAEFSSGRSFGGHGGELIVLALPSLFILKKLQKHPEYGKLFMTTGEELKPVMHAGFIVAGLAFFAFILNLTWFYAHDTPRIALGVVVLWFLTFATTVGFFEKPSKK